MIFFSLLFNFNIEAFNNDLSTSSSKSLDVISGSVPSISESNNSLPSPSLFNGSSIDTSPFNLLLFLKNINISFSIHLDAYVASFIFLSDLNVFTPFINPIVPIDIKSSNPIPVFSNFFAMYTTSLKFLSTSVCLASKLSSLSNCSIYFCSSSGSNGGGNV